MTELARYLEARDRVLQLGYSPGAGKWTEFWRGHFARARGVSADDCPWQGDPAEGRISHMRKPWLEGFGLRVHE